MLPSLLLGRRRRKLRAVGDEQGGAIETSSKPSPPVKRPAKRTLDDLCYALRRQQVVELRLGLSHGDDDSCVGFDPARRRHVHRLARAIEGCSSLQHVHLGGAIRTGAATNRLLSALNASPCRSLRSFRLVLDPGMHWLPEEPLKELLMRQTRLENIEIRGVQAVVVRRTSPANGEARQPPPKIVCKTLSHPYWCERSVISRIVVHLHRLERLTSLELVDCNATDRQANQLADFLHVRGGVRLSRLSLRLNKRLTWEGLRVLCQAPVMDRLDVSLCDLHSLEAGVVAASIAKRPWPLRELKLCGNSNIGTSGWIALTSPECCNKLTVIDLSHCVASCSKAAAILDSLGRSLSPTSRLREVTMQGCRGPQLNDEGRDSVFSEALCRLLKQSCSLRVVRLGSSMATSNLHCGRAWTPKELSHVLDALQPNYEMEVLLYDSWRCDGGTADESSAALDEIRCGLDFVLRLNRAGRRHLLDRNDRYPAVQERRSSGNERPKWRGDDGWLHLLEKAGKDDLDVLYWVVRESADRFGTGACRSREALDAAH